MNVTPLKTNKVAAPLDFNEVAAALTAGIKNVAPARKSQTIALRLIALMVRHQSPGFEYATLASEARKAGVTPSALSRAADRAEEALAVHRRTIAQARSLCAQR